MAADKEEFSGTFLVKQKEVLYARLDQVLQFLKEDTAERVDGLLAEIEQILRGICKDSVWLDAAQNWRPKIMGLSEKDIESTNSSVLELFQKAVKNNLPHLSFWLCETCFLPDEVELCRTAVERFFDNVPNYRVRSLKRFFEKKYLQGDLGTYFYKICAGKTLARDEIAMEGLELFRALLELIPDVNVPMIWRNGEESCEYLPLVAIAGNEYFSQNVGKMRMMALLLARGADINAIDTGYLRREPTTSCAPIGGSALYATYMIRDVRAIAWLVSLGANVNQRISDGRVSEVSFSERVFADLQKHALENIGFYPDKFYVALLIVFLKNGAALEEKQLAWLNDYLDEALASYRNPTYHPPLKNLYSVGGEKSTSWADEKWKNDVQRLKEIVSSPSVQWKAALGIHGQDSSAARMEVVTVLALCAVYPDGELSGQCRYAHAQIARLALETVDQIFECRGHLRSGHVDVDKNGRPVSYELLAAVETGDYAKMCKLLCEAAPCLGIDREGNNILHLACKKKNKYLYDTHTLDGRVWLLAKDQNDRGHIPLQTACLYGSGGMVEDLIRLHPDPVALIDHEGNTLLHLAYMREDSEDSEEITSRLLACGWNPEAKNHAGLTPREAGEKLAAEKAAQAGRDHFGVFAVAYGADGATPATSMGMAPLG